MLVFAMLPALRLLCSAIKRSKLTCGIFLYVVDRKNFQKQKEKTEKEAEKAG